MTQPKSIIPLTRFGGAGAAHAAGTCLHDGLSPARPTAGPGIPPGAAAAGTVQGPVLARESRQDQACRIFGRGKQREHHQLGSSSSLPSPTL